MMNPFYCCSDSLYSGLGKGASLSDTALRNSSVKSVLLYCRWLKILGKRWSLKVVPGISIKHWKLKPVYQILSNLNPDPYPGFLKPDPYADFGQQKMQI